MGKTVVAAAFLLAACGGEESLAIQVSTGDSSITTIELFVGSAPCASCEGVAPPTATVKPLGPVEYTGMGDRFVATVGSDGIAGFLVAPSADGAQVDKLAAVGFTADGTPKGFVLDDAGFSVTALHGTIRRYELASRTIVQAQPPGASPGAAPKNGDDDPAETVVVWRAPNAAPTTPSCLAIEHSDSTNEFLVPTSDPDCDGIVANECDPNWYMHTGGDGPCFTRLGTATACVIGRSPACIDGAAPVCTPVLAGKFCVPDQACDLCNDLDLDSPSCLSLLTDPLVSGTTPVITSLECSVSYALTANNIATICDEGGANVTIPVLASSNGCDPGFVATSQTIQNVSPMQKIAVATPTVEGELGIDQLSTPCTFTVTPGLHTVGGLVPQQAIGNGVFTLDAGLRTLVMPVVVDFKAVAACTPSAFPTCQVTNHNDQIYSCSQ